jgi:hypothetical protein
MMLCNVICVFLVHVLSPQFIQSPRFLQSLEIDETDCAKVSAVEICKYLTCFGWRTRRTFAIDAGSVR